MSEFNVVLNNLFYSTDHKKWEAATVKISKVILNIKTGEKSLELDFKSIKLLNLKHWAKDKTVVSLSGEVDGAFYLGGEKEKVTSLFLKLTHILSRKQNLPVKEADDDLDMGNEWLGDTLIAVIRSIEEKNGKKDVIELFENIGYSKGRDLSLNCKEGSIRGAVDKVVKELAPVCKLNMHSIDVTDKKIVADFEIRDCLIKNIHRSNKLDYPSALCITLVGFVRAIIETSSKGKNIEYDQWRSSIEDKCFSKLTVHLPEHYNDESCDRKFWKG